MRKSRTLSKQLTTSNQTLYTVPANFEGYVTNITIVNEVTAQRTVTLELYNSTDAAFYKVTNEMPLGVNGVVMLENALYLKPGDYIRGLADANSAVTVHILSHEEYFPK